MSFVYRVLEVPSIYRAVQAMVAPGAGTGLRRLARDVVARFGLQGPALDVGCGPLSHLDQTGRDLVGLDISLPYVTAFPRTGVVGSADRLPFAAGAFKTVWTLGLLHHLPDSLAAESVREMTRVCARGGTVMVVDAVMPRSPWLSPYVYATRRMDRGRHMRTQTALERLLPVKADWSIERRTYSYAGHELIVCAWTKQA